MKTTIFRTLLSFCFTMIAFISQAQVTVNSLSELLPYLGQDNVNVKLAPGTYEVTADNADDYGQYEEHYRTVYTLFLFSGNNSTYDFTDVTINVEAAVLSSFGNVDIYEIRVAGNNNLLKNLTLTDVGSVYDAPSKSANNIVMDGQNNTIDGFYVTAKGSSPYGYGDIFGKGGGAMVTLKKHCGILIRGDYNNLENTTLIHHAFGHCVFMQAANHPTIDGCHIEGEMRSTDDILAEEGTGSTADNLNFETVFGYKLPPGFMIALCEAGIRSYNAGETFIDGVSYSRGTNDVTVLNTVVKNTRTACTISQGSGDRYVENVTSIGNEMGFGIGGGKVVNCFSDAAYGPIYDGNRYIEGSVTLIAPENGYYNGSKSIATFTGGTFTMYSTTTDVPSDYSIQLGSYRSFRHQEGSLYLYQIDTVFSGGTVYNHSDVAIDLASGASNCDIFTCGPVVDNGSGNSIDYWDDCQIVTNPICTKSIGLTQAECYDDSLGVQVVDGSVVGYIENGNWASYTGLNLTDMNSIEVTYSSGKQGGSVEVRLDAVDGVLVGKLDLVNTGGWDTWETSTANIDRVDGVHDLFLVFTGGDDYLFDLDKFGFSEDVFCDGSTERIEAECYDGMSGIQTETCSEGTENVGYINNGDWLFFQNVDLTDMQSIKARVACNFTGGMIEVRTGSESGTLIGEIHVTNTGGNQEWETDSTDILPTTGLNDVYLVFTGGDGYLFNVNWLEFSAESNIVTSVTDLEETSLSIYPNPTTGVVHLPEGSDYEILDMFGEIIQTGTGSTVNLSNQLKGIYFINIKTSIQSAQFKLIKE